MKYNKISPYIGYFCAGAIWFWATVCAMAQSDPEANPPDLDPANNTPPALLNPEQALAERLELVLVDGELVWLSPDEGKFPVIFRPAKRVPRVGAFIIVGASGEILNNDRIYRALAESVPAVGWATVLLQAPPAHVQETEQIALTVARVDAAIAHLRAQKISNIVIVARADGAQGALASTQVKSSPLVAGFVGMGVWHADLKEMRIPVLSVIGTRDTAAVQSQARREGRQGPEQLAIESVIIDGAGPRFRGYEALVAKRIRGWAERATPGMPVL